MLTVKIKTMLGHFDIMAERPHIVIHPLSFKSLISVNCIELFETKTSFKHWLLPIKSDKNLQCTTWVATK